MALVGPAAAVGLVVVFGAACDTSVGDVRDERAPAVRDPLRHAERPQLVVYVGSVDDRELYAFNGRHGWRRIDNARSRLGAYEPVVPQITVSRAVREGEMRSFSGPASARTVPLGSW